MKNWKKNRRKWDETLWFFKNKLYIFCLQNLLIIVMLMSRSKDVPSVWQSSWKTRCTWLSGFDIFESLSSITLSTWYVQESIGNKLSNIDKGCKEELKKLTHF